MKQYKPAARVLRVLCILAEIAILWLMPECSINPVGTVLARDFGTTVLNIAITAVPLFILSVITGRFRLSLGICGGILFVFSVVNCYVYTLHGAPIRLSEIATVGTAADVLGGYRLSFPDTLWTELALAAAGIFLFLVPLRKTAVSAPRPLTVRLCSLVLLAVCCAIAVPPFAGNDRSRRPDLGYSWKVSVTVSGYPACLVEDTVQFFSSTVAPDGYSPEAAEAAAGKFPASAGSSALPDVILILNETFYDPSVFSSLNLETDVPYLDAFNGIRGARGYAVVPTTGTNSSEYELLTWNAKSLVNASAPFNFLPFTEANSVVRYLSSLGYESWALHGLGGANYSRYKVYPELGFDHVLFESDFESSERYGKRYRTDADDYRQLIRCYESGGDTPRFLYLLTYQNHGGWEQNDESFDTVHATVCEGQDPGVMNEYLTGIRMSSDAVAELTEYFSGVDRPVLLIMVGDHPPVFLMNRADSEVTYSSDSSVISYLHRCATPYLVWSNQTEFRADYEWITLTDLVPWAFRSAGMPLSGYARSLLALQAEYPLHVSGYAVDPSGCLTRFSSAADAPEAYRDALYLGYNNLQDPAGRFQTVFDAK